MNRVRKGIYIASLDAKDIYLSNNYENSKLNEHGYSLSTKTGTINYRKFINSLDYSLDLIKLREVAERTIGKKQFSFYHDGKEFSKAVINVTFKYSVKQWNNVYSSIWVKKGHDVRNRSFVDGVVVDDDEIIAIDTSSGEQKVPTNVTVKNVRELRDELYEHGFIVDGVKYIRWKRSSGSARLGKCLFIDERLYDDFHEWDLCGLDVQDGDKIDLAAFESYLSLSSSSIIDTMRISPKNILVIPDYDSTFQTDSMVVKYKENSNELEASESNITTSNSLFDGQSLIDVSLLGKYRDKGMVLLRNRFFKSCCFNTNLQQWFKDKGITDIAQLHEEGLTMADTIEDVKFVTTPNSIKYLKLLPRHLTHEQKVSRWFDSLESMFGIVKYDKPTDFFDGRMVSVHYQLLNTLELSYQDMEKLLKESLDYIQLLNIDPEVFKYHMGCEVNRERELKSNVMKSRTEVVYKMMNLSDTFFQTKFYHDFKQEQIRSFKTNLKKGHILVNGNYSTLFGNPYEMLQFTIGEFDGSSNVFNGFEVYSPRFDDGKDLSGCRSPHISLSNVLVVKNKYDERLIKYFNLTDEIVCINAIGVDVLEILSGADYDSDQILITDNTIIIEASKKNFGKYLVPAIQIESVRVERTYSKRQLSDLDHKTSDNKIGEVVNLSQELNSLLWQSVNSNKKDNNAKDIYYDICILNALSCVSIDLAKKEFEVSISKELEKIRERWIEVCDETGKKIKPAFLGFISKVKGYQNHENKKYKHMETPMDYLLQIVTKHRSKRSSSSSKLPLSECFKPITNKSVNWHQIKSIVDACETTMMANSAIWNRDYYTIDPNKLKKQVYYSVKEDFVKYVHRMKMNDATLYHLLSYVDNKEYSHIKTLLFDVLFSYRNDRLISLLKQMTPRVESLVEVKQTNTKGDVVLYGINFQKISNF